MPKPDQLVSLSTLLIPSRDLGSGACSSHTEPPTIRRTWARMRCGQLTKTPSPSHYEKKTRYTCTSIHRTTPDIRKKPRRLNSTPSMKPTRATVTTKMVLMRTGPTKMVLMKMGPVKTVTTRTALTKAVLTKTEPKKTALTRTEPKKTALTRTARPMLVRMKTVTIRTVRAMMARRTTVRVPILMTDPIKVLRVTALMMTRRALNRRINC